MHECLLRRRHASSPAACLLLSSFASLAGPRDAEQFESWRPRRCVLDRSGSSTHGGCRRRRRRSTVATAASEGSVWSRLLGVGRGASLVSNSTSASGSWREHGGSEAWRRPGGGRATANGGEAAWPAREPRAEAVRRKTEAKHRGRRAKAGVSAEVAMPACRGWRPASGSRHERGGGDAGEPRTEAGTTASGDLCVPASWCGRREPARRRDGCAPFFRRVCRGRASNMSNCS